MILFRVLLLPTLLPLQKHMNMASQVSRSPPQARISLHSELQIHTSDNSTVATSQMNSAISSVASQVAGERRPKKTTITLQVGRRERHPAKQVSQPTSRLYSPEVSQNDTDRRNKFDLAELEERCGITWDNQHQMDS